MVNARFGATAALSVVQHGADLGLKTLPNCTLESSRDDERQRVAELVAMVARWRGFGTSTATKVLHKKRPALIPILDNQAIFGAYLDPRWPGRRSGQDSVYGVQLVRAALDRLVVDLTRHENQRAWQVLAHMEPGRSRIELFDMVSERVLRPGSGVADLGGRPGQRASTPNSVALARCSNSRQPSRIA